MIIVDMAEDAPGNKAILVAQNYMPAQDIHIVTNLNNQSVSPWYIVKSGTSHFSFPEYSFDDTDIKRFR